MWIGGRLISKAESWFQIANILDILVTNKWISFLHVAYLLLYYKM